MIDRDRRALQVLAGFLTLIIGALWWVLPGPEPRTRLLTVVLFASAAAIAELHPIRHRLGDPIPASLAVVGAAAILGMSPVAVAVIAGLGWGVARVIDRDLRQPHGVLIRAAAGWALSGLAALGAWLLQLRFTGRVAEGLPAAELQVGPALAVSMAIILGIPAVWAVGRLRGRWRFVARRVGEAIRSTWMIGLAITSTAVLGALVHPVLDHWTLPTMLLPLLAARIGLDRYAVATRAYDQTIRAMSRLPEHLGSVSADHGIRVADLAHEVALELGLDAGTLNDLEHAAHLHELGRVAIERDTGQVGGRRALATAGAEVIAEATASLDRVARIIAAHGEPTLAHPQDVRVPARIIAACCEADRYDADLRRAGQRDELVVRLVREVGDLEVVGALARVLDRRVFAA
ncbi:MAG TPA: HD domain-containing protein [Egicoccus sp.]|nr:HD domain-containing protein [Egicoccus sp.]HSK24179.1 HD domain-containing protein [Egicoccus sp.]